MLKHPGISPNDWNIQGYLQMSDPRKKSKFVILRCTNIAIQLYTSFKCAHFPRSSVGVPESIFNNRCNCPWKMAKWWHFCLPTLGKTTTGLCGRCLDLGDPMSTNPLTCQGVCLLALKKKHISFHSSMVLDFGVGKAFVVFVALPSNVFKGPYFIIHLSVRQEFPYLPC